MFQVLVSVPVSVVIYNCLLGIEYISMLHIFVIIMIIGIGADDLFVFHDFWENARKVPALKKQPILRITHSFWQSTQAMMLTSLTSTVAFLACSITPVRPL